MKKGIIIGIILAMLLCLCACGRGAGESLNPDESKSGGKEEISLAGKAFYNTYEPQENGGHACILFGDDGTVSMVEYCIDGPVEISGSYKITDKTVSVSLSGAQLADYADASKTSPCDLPVKNITFGVINENALSLKTDLLFSYAGNIFICADSAQALDKAMEAQRANIKDILGGKTYYNTIDRYGNADTSYITFNADGTFEMKEHYHEEFISVSGKWEASAYKLLCKVEQCGAGDFKEISFKITDFENLILEDDLFSSREDDLFTDRKITLDYESESAGGIFTNASQKARGEFGASVLTLRDDGTFTLDEINGMGAVQVNGLYGREGDVLMFSNYEHILYNSKGEEVLNFEFRVIDSNTLELMRSLDGSRQGDCFTVSGELPANFTPKVEDDVSGYLYLHEPIQDVVEEYLPAIFLFADGTFLVKENVYEGMGKYEGTYTDKGSLVTLSVTDTNMTGFSGADVTEIILEKSNRGYILRTDLCMSVNGDEFILQ